MIRHASLSDLDALVQLETRNFNSDHLSRRSFQHLLARGNAIVLIDEVLGTLRGYALLRFHARSPHARLYSIAIDHAYRGHGIGRTLLAAAEEIAHKHGVIGLRLEVREDNHTAVRLYEKAGYRLFGRYLDYYSDHANALRMEKHLIQPSAARAVRAKHTLHSAA
ncbi:MAG: GNAT family N-acetyltransferase [Gammaproteobacteria bacterium]